MHYRKLCKHFPCIVAYKMCKCEENCRKHEKRDAGIDYFEYGESIIYNQKGKWHKGFYVTKLDHGHICTDDCSIILEEKSYTSFRVESVKKERRKIKRK